MTKEIQLNQFGQGLAVAFKNKSTDSIHVWVFSTVSARDERLAYLRELPHCEILNEDVVATVY